MSSRRNVRDPLDALGLGQAKPLADFGDERGKLERLALGRGLLRLAEIEGTGTEPDGTIERSEQLRHELLHALVLDAAQAVGEELRA